MANMSYCRFHNTRIDLNDCLDALNDYEELSMEEHDEFKRMFSSFVDFLYDYGIIEENYDDVTERLEDYFDSVKIEE